MCRSHICVWVAVAAFCAMILGPGTGEGAAATSTSTPTALSTGSISGTVSDAEGNPIEDAQVRAGPAEAATGPDGSYTITGLASDDYVVAAWAEGYAHEYYDDVRDIDDAIPVAVVEGEDTPDIDFSLDAGGSISGTVTDAQGNPVGDFRVEAHPYDAHPFESGGTWGVERTWPDGSYTITGLPTVRYRVEAKAEGYIREYYDGVREWKNAAPVSVAEGEDTPNIDFSLDVGGSISGTVTDAQGNPVEGAWVMADSCEPGNLFCYAWRDAQTAPDGSYTIKGLATGSYSVFAYTEAHAPEYYEGVFWHEDATPVVVVEGEDTSSIDFSLDPGGRMSGVVTDSQGNPIVGAWVFPDPYDHAVPWVWPLKHWGGWATGPDGSYSISDLGTGSYVVWVVKEGYSAECYDGVFWQEEATPVAVVVGQETSDIDFSLGPGGTISGVVTDSQGNPIVGARVHSEPYDHAMPWWWAPAQYFREWAAATSGSNGSYTIPDLGSSSYRVRADAEGYMGEYYDGVWKQEDANPVPAVAGQDTPNVDFTLGLDACPSEDSAGFDANNDGCIDKIEDLGTFVDALFMSEVIHSTMHTSLHAKIDAAARVATRDNVCAAVNMLDALKGQIEAQTGKKISEDAAPMLLEFITNAQNYLLMTTAVGSC